MLGPIFCRGPLFRPKMWGRFARGSARTPLLRAELPRILATPPTRSHLASSAIVAAIGTGDALPRGVISLHGLDWCQDKSAPAIVRSSARYPSVPIDTCASSSCRRHGSCWSGSSQPGGSPTGSNPGLRLPKSGCITTCWAIALANKLARMVRSLLTIAPCRSGSPQNSGRS